MPIKERTKIRGKGKKKRKRKEREIETESGRETDGVMNQGRESWTRKRRTHDLLFENENTKLNIVDEIAYVSICACNII